MRETIRKKTWEAAHPRARQGYLKAFLKVGEPPVVRSCQLWVRESVGADLGQDTEMPVGCTDCKFDYSKTQTLKNSSFFHVFSV